MAEAFLGEVRVFGFNFAPYGWAQCNGQILAISPNTALFSLLGTYYGGNGSSNFGLPNMQGNLAISQGQGSGLQDYILGQRDGTPTVTLLTSEIPVHNHNLLTDITNSVDGSAPTNAALGTSASTLLYSNATSPIAPMNIQGLGPSGNSQAHNNMMPYLVLNFCICMQGVFPARP